MKNASISIQPPAEAPVSFKGYRFPPDIICYAVWLYYRLPLSLRMIGELLAARGIELTYETVRGWATTFSLSTAKRIRATAPGRVREKVMRRFKSVRQLQRFCSAHG